MKKSRFTEEKMVKILREADRSPVQEVAKKHGISDQTIYGWRKRFGQLEAVDVRRLRQLEQENAKLKKLVAEHDLEIDAMREVARKKWRARASEGSRSRMCESAACRFGGRARCSRSLGQRSATSRSWRSGMPRWSRRCGSSRASTRATGIGASRCSWRAAAWR